MAMVCVDCASSSSASSDEWSTGAIVGVVVGCVVALLLLVACLCCLTHPRHVPDEARGTEVMVSGKTHEEVLAPAMGPTTDDIMNDNVVAL